MAAPGFNSTNSTFTTNGGKIKSYEKLSLVGNNAFLLIFPDVPIQAEYPELTAINGFNKHICLGPNTGTEYKESKKVFQPLFSI